MSLVREALPLNDLRDVGILVEAPGETVRAALGVRAHPIGSPGDPETGWLISDLARGLDGEHRRPTGDHVLGAAPASLTLADLTSRREVGRALDLGTGCGVQALLLTGHAGQVVATDVNERALRLAATAAALNDVRIDLRPGSLYDPVPDERFDLIVSNPPYVMAPPAPAGEQLTYRQSGFAGDGLVEAVIRGGAGHLAEGGMLQALGNWAIPADGSWQDRLASWAQGSGCDLWVIERERLDRFTYIEMWLTDAGLTPGPQWAAEYRRWLDYFDAIGVESVGLGWFALTRSGREVPDVRIESWPWAVHQPVGEVFAHRRQHVDAALAPTDDLLRARPRIGEDIVQESTATPGADDPQHIVLRSRGGLGRAIEADTALAAVLGACDGELPLGRIIAAVATLIDEDAAPLAARLLPPLRQALRDGMLETD